MGKGENDSLVAQTDRLPPHWSHQPPRFAVTASGVVRARWLHRRLAAGRLGLSFGPLAERWTRDESVPSKVRELIAERERAGFVELRNLNYFKQARAEGGTVVWPHEQDICPDTVYEDSKKLISM